MCKREQNASESLPARFSRSCRGVCLTAAGFVEALLLRKAPASPGLTPLLLFYASFSSRWDEFGQNRRGSESSAADARRGRRVSFTEKLQQQQRNFRELKQRVFRRRVGRYTPSDSIPSSPDHFQRLSEAGGFFFKACSSSFNHVTCPCLLICFQVSLNGLKNLAGFLIVSRKNVRMSLACSQ